MGETLFRAHKRSSYAFFPITGAISLVRRLQMDVTVEVAIIGSEGLVGVNIFTGAPNCTTGSSREPAKRGACRRVPDGAVESYAAVERVYAMNRSNWLAVGRSTVLLPTAHGQLPTPTIQSGAFERFGAARA